MTSLRIISLILSVMLCACALISCDSGSDNEGYDAQQNKTAQTTSDTFTDTSDGDDVDIAMINGIPLEDFTVIYNAQDVDYSKRAAEYICKQIEERTSVCLDLKEDDTGIYAHEIIVGETSRALSRSLDADTQGVQFAICANDDHVAMEGDYFVIAAAAYFFVDTYITGQIFDSAVPKEVKIHEPIVEEAKNFVLLIGDGMGVNQTLLFDKVSMSLTSGKNYNDGEDIFYGYLLPYQGRSRTNSLSGVTDSAAGGTALSTGYKTINKYVGKDKNGKDLLSLTELAGSMGKATAVMSTEAATGATPASFSAHAMSRYDTDNINRTQVKLRSEYGTLIDCNYDVYDKKGVADIQDKVKSNLNVLSRNEKGFFLMYEEAHIDKHCHSNNQIKTFDALMRFNQVIGTVMEFAFYNPDTFVLITADHETGGLIPNSSGGFSFTSTDHTGVDVPIFAYGDGAEYFNEKTVENIQIPKQIAKLWGKVDFGQ